MPKQRTVKTSAVIEVLTFADDLIVTEPVNYPPHFYGSKKDVKQISQYSYALDATSAF